MFGVVVARSKPKVQGTQGPYILRGHEITPVPPSSMLSSEYTQCPAVRPEGS
jgi:hypothetical protein